MKCAHALLVYLLSQIRNNKWTFQSIDLLSQSRDRRSIQELFMRTFTDF